MKGKPIKQWATDDRPREKLVQKGAQNLSNSELLAIVINNGTHCFSAVDIAKSLLDCSGNDLHKLGRLTPKEISKLKIRGLGEKRAMSIVAALELGIRRNAGSKKEAITHSTDMVHYLKVHLQFKKQEAFAVVFLNANNKVNHFEIISEGGITGTVADPRVIFRKALEHEAVSIILCHNHPSGSLRPSRADKELTRKLKEGAALFDIQVLDHIIVSEEGFYSFADQGLL
ncbi:RadC family protein [Deminuibacter soli]|uniref:DNA repair protein RadC n=1 Tax=Deminuibacter soli TaxID=2291815 RepID=A0A3E1NDS5_9BACT|nr:DNA repair protein RadC [Deminuibacter soli]RFM25994.1 DNA repair protein RadC [Deminuibacter soli]